MTVACTFYIGVAILLASSPPDSGEKTDVSLVTHVERYLSADDEQVRAELLERIESSAGDAPTAVVAALREARLWERPAEPAGSLTDSLATGGRVNATFRLPGAYHPAKSWPLVIAMPARGSGAPEALRAAAEELGAEGDSCILVGLSAPFGGRFHRAEGESVTLPSLLTEVGRRFHVDGDRVYLFGTAGGADAAWIAALMHADSFAGAMLDGGHPQVPYPAEILPLLLGNLQNTPVFLRPGAATSASERFPEARLFQTAVLDFARHLRVAIIPVADESSMGSGGAAGFRDALLRRREIRREVGHWFRYPEQGQAGFLRVVEPRGEVWTEDQLSILTAGGTDRRDYVVQVVQDRMMFVGGKVDGQTLTVYGKGCAAVEVLFQEGLVDLARPVTVICNGQRRFEGRIEPSIRSMLESARETWDFSRVVLARRTFQLSTDAVMPGQQDPIPNEASSSTGSGRGK